MPKKLRPSSLNKGSFLLRKGAGIIAASVLLLTSCSVQDTAAVKASNVLENIEVNLNNSAQVSKVHSTVISVDGSSQKSSSEEQNFEPRDVVNDLPVRITTHYQTEQSSGNNLNDLDGYNGDVSIDISIENLTVKPQELTYDVEGVQKKKTALVGAPLSIAGSTTFDTLGPADIISEATLGHGKTNGIISTDNSGHAVIQWGKILAGPTTGTSTTFTVNLKAKNFKVPSFNIAVHPGLTTDLTSSGAIASAFTNEQDSELNLMQQTVDIVTEANQSLSDASTIVSRVRDNLTTTSDALKSTTVKELQDSSDKLTKRLTDLQEKMAGLKINLSDSAKGSQQQILDQMQQTVDSLEKFLGQKGDQVPAPTIDAGTCSVNISQPANGTTVYSNMVQLSNVLQAYSQANIDCQGKMTNIVNSLLGPENPTNDTCNDSASAACSIFKSRAVAVTTLLDATVKTTQMAQSLQPGSTEPLKNNLKDIIDSMSSLQQNIDDLKDPTTQQTVVAIPSADPTATSTATATQAPTDIAKNLDDLDQNIVDSNKALQSLEDLYTKIHETAQNALNELAKNDLDKGSIIEQNRDLADQLCSLSDNGNQQPGKLSQEEINRLRGYLTDVPCGVTPTPTDSATILGFFTSAPATPSPSASTSTPEASPIASGLPIEKAVTASGSPKPSDSQSASASSSPSNAETTPSVPQTSASTQVEPTSPTASSTSTSSASSTPQQSPDATASLKAPAKYHDPLNRRLQNQADLWTSVLNATDTTSDQSELKQKFNLIRTTYKQVTDTTTAIRGLLSIKNPDQNQPSNPVTNDSIKAVKDAMPNLQNKIGTLSTSIDTLDQEQQKLNDGLREMSKNASPEDAANINKILDEQVRNISTQRQNATQDINQLFSQHVNTLTGSSTSVADTAQSLFKDQEQKLNQAAQQQVTQADERTQSALQEIQKSHDSATQDVAGASVLLTQDLQKIMLDIGDTSVTGSGLLGSLLNNASNAGNADYQLALATENAHKYSNLRADDMEAVRLKQAQYKASLDALSTLPTFQYKNSAGAKVKTIYTFTIGGDQKSAK